MSNKTQDWTQVILIQPLINDRELRQKYVKINPNSWQLIWESTSAYHICPFDGAFRSCNDCGAGEEDFDTAYCDSKIIFVDDKELLERISDCKKAGLKVQIVR